MTYKEIIVLVSKQLNLPYEVVDLAYKSYWEFIRNTITNLPLKEDITEEEFSKLRTNFSIPYIGKLSCTYDRMMKIKKRYNILKDIKNAKSKED